MFKNSKTGKVDSISVSELTQAQWRRVCLGHGIKLCSSTGHIYKYDGFKDTVSQRYQIQSIKIDLFAPPSILSFHALNVHPSLYVQDLEKISEYFKANYKVELMEKDMSVKGWNWGTAKFNGQCSSDATLFLRYVQYCILNSDLNSTLLKIKVPNRGFCNNAIEEPCVVPKRTSQRTEPCFS